MDSQTEDVGKTAGPDDLLGGLAEAGRRDRAAAAGGDLEDFAERGRSRVLVVLLARVIATRVPGRAGVALSVVLMGAWPDLIIQVAAVATGGDPLPTTSDQLFGLAASINNVAMLSLAWFAWRSTPDLAADLSELLAGSPDRQEFTRWLIGRLRLGRQLAASAAGSAAAAALVYAASQQQPTPVEPNLWFYLPAVWSGFLGGNVVYWLYTTAEVPLRLQRCEHLRMAWLDPAHTPAIVRLCSTYARIALSMGLGVLITELGLIAVTSERPPALMRVFVVGFPVFAVLTALYVGIQPYITLSRIVRRHIVMTVSPLMAQMAHPPGELLMHPELDSAFRTYSHFRALPRLPVKTASLLQYAAGILASLIIYFVQQSLK